MIDKAAIMESPSVEKSEENFRCESKIDDPPEVLLVEILCRLSCNNKLIFQYKLVSKAWYNLISSSYFVHRYTSLQRQKQTPVLKTLVSIDVMAKILYPVITSDDPFFKAHARNFTLNFMPCYSQSDYIEERAREYPYNRPDFENPDSIIPPIVLGTCNDLVLCCATTFYQRHYYLCNPYTKHWLALPPTPQVFQHSVVAFVCDPYYRLQEGKDGTPSIIVNAEYKWKVVRFVPNASDPSFHFEIFSSETRRWREVHVTSSRSFLSFVIPPDHFSPRSTSYVVYNGMLYWWSDKGLVLELDLTKCDGTHRFIEAPDDYRKKGNMAWLGFGMLGVNSQGRLRFCIHCHYLTPEDHEEGHQSFRVLELKQVVEDDQDRFKWLTESVPINCEGISPSIPNTIKVLAFHPNNDDVVYMNHGVQTFTCNLDEGRLEKIAATLRRGMYSTAFSYPFSLPWWPTPIPKP